MRKIQSEPNLKKKVDIIKYKILYLVKLFGNELTYAPRCRK